MKLRQRFWLRGGLILLALVAHELLARYLTRSDLIEQLLVRQKLSTALLAGVLAILRLYLMLLLPARLAAWAVSHTQKARAATPNQE